MYTACACACACAWGHRAERPLLQRRRDVLDAVLPQRRVLGRTSLVHHRREAVAAAAVDGDRLQRDARGVGLPWRVKGGKSE